MQAVKASVVRLNLSAFVSPPVLLHLFSTRSTSVSSASYGADPIGKGFDCDGYQSEPKAMEGAFDGPNHGVLMEGINVIGGARTDLEGGSYLIRRPLRFPSAGAGNLVVSISFCQTILNLSKASLQVELGAGISSFKYVSMARLCDVI
ncbi:unnamed protein product [Brassica oleracea var. botrytis]